MFENSPDKMFWNNGSFVPADFLDSIKHWAHMAKFNTYI